MSAAAVTDAACAAARHGQLAVLEWVLEGHPQPDMLAIDVGPTAANEGQLAVLKWVWQRHLEQQQTSTTIAHDIACSAAENGQLGVLEWLWQLQATNADAWWDAGVAQAAAIKGQVQVVQWMQGQQCPMDKAACITVAEYMFASLPRGHPLKNACRAVVILLEDGG
jgi:hypothetical protein